MSDQHNSSTADYPIREERLIEEHRHTFGHNELVEILNPKGQPTGSRGYFNGIEIDMFYQPTGKADIAIVNGPNIFVPLKQLRSVKH